MNALSTAIYSKLSGDATLTAMLATYSPPGGGPNAPAIFDIDPIPQDTRRPYVAWSGSLHDAPFGGKVEETVGREIQLDIRAVVDATGSTQTLDSIVERIRVLMHNVTLTVGGYTNIIARCISGPRNIPSDELRMARALTFQWFLQ